MGSSAVLRCLFTFALISWVVSSVDTASVQSSTTHSHNDDFESWKATSFPYGFQIDDVQNDQGLPHPDKTQIPPLQKYSAYSPYSKFLSSPTLFTERPLANSELAYFLPEFMRFMESMMIIMANTPRYPVRPADHSSFSQPAKAEISSHTIPNYEYLSSSSHEKNKVDVNFKHDQNQYSVNPSHEFLRSRGAKEQRGEREFRQGQNPSIPRSPGSFQDALPEAENNHEISEETDIPLKTLNFAKHLSKYCVFQGISPLSTDKCNKYLVCLPARFNRFNAYIAECPQDKKFSTIYRRCVQPYLVPECFRYSPWGSSSGDHNPDSQVETFRLTQFQKKKYEKPLYRPIKGVPKFAIEDIQDGVDSNIEPPFTKSQAFKVGQNISDFEHEKNNDSVSHTPPEDDDLPDRNHTGNAILVVSEFNQSFTGTINHTENPNSTFSIVNGRNFTDEDIKIIDTEIIPTEESSSQIKQNQTSSAEVPDMQSNVTQDLFPPKFHLVEEPLQVQIQPNQTIPLDSEELHTNTGSKENDNSYETNYQGIYDNNEHYNNTDDSTIVTSSLPPGLLLHNFTHSSDNFSNDSVSDTDAPPEVETVVEEPVDESIITDVIPTHLNGSSDAILKHRELHNETTFSLESETGSIIAGVIQNQLNDSSTTNAEQREFQNETTFSLESETGSIIAGAIQNQLNDSSATNAEQRESQNETAISFESEAGPIVAGAIQNQLNDSSTTNEEQREFQNETAISFESEAGPIVAGAIQNQLNDSSTTNEEQREFQNETAISLEFEAGPIVAGTIQNNLNDSSTTNLEHKDLHDEEKSEISYSYSPIVYDEESQEVANSPSDSKPSDEDPIHSRTHQPTSTYSDNPAVPQEENYDYPSYDTHHDRDHSFDNVGDVIMDTPYSFPPETDTDPVRRRRAVRDTHSRVWRKQ